MLLTLHRTCSSSPSQLQVLTTAQSSNDALMATMTQIANLLSGFQKQFHNQLTASDFSNSKILMLEVKDMLQDSAKNQREQRILSTSKIRCDIEAKRKREYLMQNLKHSHQMSNCTALPMDRNLWQCLQQLSSMSIMRMNMIQTWMKAPMLLPAFMANLSSTSAPTCQVNEVPLQCSDNEIFDIVE
ncbi:hypothetical protein Tco_1367628 [Tanacetum coccineum]